jgi:hypothetical protein
MTADKRQVATDALETLGSILTGSEKRDAIHLGVEPVIAGERLRAGEDVGIADGKAYRKGVKHIGIVDPFLKEFVDPGERFWLVVYPRQITSLRHVWEHPDFPVSGETGTPLKETLKSDSENWMRAWAVEHMSEDYCGASEDSKIDPETSYQMAINAGHDNYIGPYESAREYIDDVWWTHWEAITGCRGDRGTHFSCSC